MAEHRAKLSSQPLSPRSVPGCQIEFTSKLDFDQLLPPPCHSSSQQPDTGALRSFEVNTGRRREKLGAEPRPGFSLFVSLPGEWTNLIWYSIWHGGWKTCQYSTLYPLPSPPSLNNTSPQRRKTKNTRYHLLTLNILFPLVGSLSCDGDNNDIMRAQCGGDEPRLGVPCDRLRL